LARVLAFAEIVGDNAVEFALLYQQPVREQIPTYGIPVYLLRYSV
jgi:hypothetical protein